MLLLTGEYQHTIDNKNRIFISNKLVSQINDAKYGKNFYLILSANGILSLYPEEYFRQITLAMASERNAPDEVVAFERLSFALASKIELDSQGRLLLNERLRKRVGLKKNITLIGVRDHIEFWNSEDWKQYLADNITQYQEQITKARQVVLSNEIG